MLVKDNYNEVKKWNKIQAKRNDVEVDEGGDKLKKGLKMKGE
jgi:hypothetical protein